MKAIRIIGKRLLLIPISVFALVTLCFALVQIIPGDPAITVAGSYASPQEIARVRTELGLDRPWHERYLAYVGGLLQGDLGRSLFTGRPITSELARRVPATLQLITLALLVSWILGLSLGVAGAYFRGSWPDRVTRGMITVLQSVPDFLLSLLLIFVLYFMWQLAPAPVGQLGLSSFTPGPTGFLLIDTLLRGDMATFLQALHHLMLPVLSLGIVYSAYLGRVGRSSMTKAMQSRQVEFARACGLPEWRVVQYAFLEARAPILTYTAILFGALVGGASITETIFAWQGVGQWGLESILKVDIPVIQGVILVSGMVSILVYLFLDVLVMLLDPRVRYE